MSAPAPARKNPKVAAVASIVPGLGQFYNGQMLKGAVLLVIGLGILFLIFTANTKRGGAAQGIEIMGFILTWLVNEYDAYSTASTMAEGAT